MKSLAGLLLLAVFIGVAVAVLWPRQGTVDRKLAVTSTQPASTLYRTDPGLEPDTCVSAWLLTRRVSPGAKVIVGADIAGAVSFDVPGVPLSRQPGKCVSRVICERFGIEGAFPLGIMQVAQELELAPWSLNPDPFFEQVRAGLGEAVNASTSDQACMDHALAFLDQLERSRAAIPKVSSVPASAPATPPKLSLPAPR